MQTNHTPVIVDRGLQLSYAVAAPMIKDLDDERMADHGGWSCGFLR